MYQTPTAAPVTLDIRHAQMPTCGGKATAVPTISNRHFIAKYVITYYISSSGAHDILDTIRRSKRPCHMLHISTKWMEGWSHNNNFIEINKKPHTPFSFIHILQIHSAPNQLNRNQPSFVRLAHSVTPQACTIVYHKKNQMQMLRSVYIFQSGIVNSTQYVYTYI